MSNQYPHGSLVDAYLEVTENNASISCAARRFGVPRKTLADRVNGRTPLECMTTGRSTLFNVEQERMINSHIVTMAGYGYGYSKFELREIAGNYAYNTKLQKDNAPLSKGWVDSYLKRWPDLEMKRRRGLDVYRAKASNEENVASYFERLRNCMERNGMMEAPQSIWNIDEKGIVPHFTPIKVIGKRKRRESAITPPRGATTTIIAAGNALGTMIPPYFVIKGERLERQVLADSTPGASGTTSATGWSNGEIFQKYLSEHFLKYANPTQSQPALVLYDGHKSHVSVNIIDWAKEKHVFIFILPAHTSHFLQPLDVCCFGPLEQHLTRIKQTTMRGHENGHFNQAEVIRMSVKAYLEAMKPGNLINGFKKTGVFPFRGITAIDVNIFSPSKAFSKCDANLDLVSEEESVADEFFREKEIALLETKSKEKRMRKTVGAIVGGRELTEDSVAKSVRDHVHRSSKPTSKILFDQENSCCVCFEPNPPIDLGNDILWVGCDDCGHWVHVGLCVPLVPCGSKDRFMCPCCRCEE